MQLMQLMAALQLFNMRELSKVFQGVMLAVRDRFKRGADAIYGANVSTPEVRPLLC